MTEEECGKVLAGYCDSIAKEFPGSMVTIALRPIDDRHAIAIVSGDIEVADALSKQFGGANQKKRKVSTEGYSAVH